MLDTNVILDALQERVPFDTAAKHIMLLGQSGKIMCTLTANSVADIFYLYSKTSDKSAAKIAISALVNTYEVVSVTHDDCVEALALPNEDFEDALIEVCAKKIGADFIVTRDEAFILAATEVAAVKPDELITKIVAGR